MASEELSESLVSLIGPHGAIPSLVSGVGGGSHPAPWRSFLGLFWGYWFKGPCFGTASGPHVGDLGSLLRMLVLVEMTILHRFLEDWRGLQKSKVRREVEAIRCYPGFSAPVYRS